MGTTLEYPPLPQGKRWNVIQKISLKTGYWPGTYTTSQKTVFQFIEDLTPQEQIDVDLIIGDGGTCQDPIVFTSLNNTYILKDVFDWHAELEANTGFNIALSYRSSGTYGPDVYDEIVLQPTDPTYQSVKVLGVQDKKAFIVAIEDLGRWE